MKSKVEFLKIKGAKKDGNKFYLIAQNAKGEKIAFEVNGIK